VLDGRNFPGDGFVPATFSGFGAIPLKIIVRIDLASAG
jgi:hypothetical protein